MSECLTSDVVLFSTDLHLGLVYILDHSRAVEITYIDIDLLYGWKLSFLNKSGKLYRLILLYCPGKRNK